MGLSLCIHDCNNYVSTDSPYLLKDFGLCWIGSLSTKYMNQNIKSLYFNYKILGGMASTQPIPIHIRYTAIIFFNLIILQDTEIYLQLKAHNSSFLYTIAYLIDCRSVTCRFTDNVSIVCLHILAVGQTV